MDMKINAAKIATERKRKAWSQQHLADVSGLSLRTVQRIENNGVGSPDSVKAIAMAFDLIPADLMQYEINQPSENPTQNSKQKSKIAAILTATFIGLGAIIWISVPALSTATNESNDIQQATEQSEEHSLVETAANSWLALLDGEDYLSSWQQCDEIAKEKVTAQQWEKAVSQVRQQMGKVQSRSLSSIQLSSTLPGLPNGSYALLTFNTQFENKSLSIETIPMSKASGNWKPIGYFIR